MSLGLVQHPEPIVFKQLKKIRGNIFIDIGANIGVYSKPLSKNFRSVYVVEPNPEIFPVIEQSLRHRRNVILLNFALSNKEGRVPFYVDQIKPLQYSGSANTILPEFNYRPVSHPEINKTFNGHEGFMVPCYRFDDIFNEADLVKIDVEGAEFLVLEGMKEALSNKNIKNVVVELHDRKRKEELESLLSSYFNHSKWIDPDHLFCSLRAFA